MFSEHEKHERALVRPMFSNKFSRTFASYSKGAVLNQRGADKKAFCRGNLKHLTRKRRHIYPRGNIFHRMMILEIPKNAGWPYEQSNEL